MTPPKNYTYTYSPKSHGQCDFILHIHTPLFNIYTSYNYTRVIQMMLFYLILGLAPHGLDLGFLGLGFGLGPHILQRLIRRTLNDLAFVHFFY